MNRGEIIAAIKAKIAETLEKSKSVRVRAVESGQMDVEFVTQKDLVLKQVQDPQQREEVEKIFEDPEVINAFLEYMASLLMYKYIDAGQINNNKVVVLKVRQYKIPRLALLLQCMPVKDDCPKTPVELISGIIKSYADREDVINSIIDALIDVAKTNKTVLNTLAEKVNGIQASGSN